MAITGDEPGPDWYITSRYKAPDIFDIARKVTFDEDPRVRELAAERGQWVCSAEIKTKDGKIRKAYIDHEKGTPENPLSEREMYNKFKANATGILGQDRTDELWDSLMRLEKANRISTVAHTLSPKFQP